MKNKYSTDLVNKIKAIHQKFSAAANKTLTENDLLDMCNIFDNFELKTFKDLFYDGLSRKVTYSISDPTFPLNHADTLKCLDYILAEVTQQEQQEQ